MIKEIAFIGYPVTDVARARKFYEETFDLKPTMLAPDGNWVEYDIGAGTFAIGRYEGWNLAEGGPMMAFEVEDFDAAIARLKAAGVKFCMEPFESPVCRSAIIKDPDGNALMIHRRKEGCC